MRYIDGMIPERLKQLLKPWLSSASPEEIIEYIRAHTQEVEISESSSTDLDLDAPTIGFMEGLTQDCTTELELEILDSMNFTDVESHPPVEVSDNQYQIEVELGRGGMATVWRALDLQLNRFVAMKRLHPEKQEQNFEVENFIVEAQITAQLQHPGIVPIYEMSTDDSGDVYFTMTEVNGQTLKEVVEAVHQSSSQTEWRHSLEGWSLRRLMDLIHDVCLILAYAHDKGVVPRHQTQQYYGGVLW